MTETTPTSPAQGGTSAATRYAQTPGQHEDHDACGCGHDHHHGPHHHGHVGTIQRAGPKVGRNDPCPCGSGKKHKKCCLA
jgi:preprotein translocase subunit SecA